MKSLPTTLICTVGTSLFHPNMKNLNPDQYCEQYCRSKTPERDLSMAADWNALRRSGLVENKDTLELLLKDIKQSYNSSMFGRLAGLLTKLPAELRLCGAEINSIVAMIKKGYLAKDPHNLILLVSDTADGEAIGEVLIRYFEDANCPTRFGRCVKETVLGLQDTSPLQFQKEGLPNLVRLLGSHYRRCGGVAAINATGGYKAQIALAVAFGQATSSPVYYKHERFDQIIRFPQIPFTLDLSPLSNNLKMWADLAEPGKSFSRSEIDALLPKHQQLREQMLPLLDSIDEGETALYSLSALGMVYWEAFQTLNPDQELEPAKVTIRKGCRFRDDHYPSGFQEHVKRFYAAFPVHISECHSMPYDGQAGIQSGFFLRESQITGEYLDSNRFGARFAVMTSARNHLERKWLLAEFKKWFEGQ